MDHLLFPGITQNRLHLGVTGSIAAIKALPLLRLWRKSSLDVGVTVTEAATRFTPALAYQSLGADPVYESMYPVTPGEEYAHLAPGRTASGFVVAPATANCIAKIAHGMADDMLSCQMLAYEGPLVLAPAMNHLMWRNPATRANWDICKERGHICLEPECGELACGDEDAGRLPLLEHIYLYGLKALVPQDMVGMSVMITLGPTREQWDAVRYWSNPSSGRMGIGLAVAAWLRGATVHAVSGPVSLSIPTLFSTTNVQSALEMYTACRDLWPSIDIGCFTAAVADFSPIPHGDAKFKKERSDGDLTITFKRTTDILATLGADKRNNQRIIAFAAETDDLEANAGRKLTRKNADLVVANRIGRPGAGFGSATNEVFIMDSLGRSEKVPTLPKTTLAWRIWDWLVTL